MIITRLTACTLLSLAATLVVRPALAAPFSDVPRGHWAYRAVEECREWGMLKGYGDGRFHGNSPVTKGELATALTRLLRDIWAPWGPIPLWDPFPADLDGADPYYEQAARMRTWAIMDVDANGFWNGERLVARKEALDTFDRVLRYLYFGGLALSDVETFMAENSIECPPVPELCREREDLWHRQMQQTFPQWHQRQIAYQGPVAKSLQPLEELYPHNVVRMGWVIGFPSARLELSRPLRRYEEALILVRLRRFAAEVYSLSPDERRSRLTRLFLIL